MSTGEQISCASLRRKINLFLLKKEMTQKAFLEACGGINSNSFGRFMKLKGPWSGTENGTYWGALKFFQEREENAKKKKKEEEKEAKKAAKEEAKLEKAANKKGKASSSAAKPETTPSAGPVSASKKRSRSEALSDTEDETGSEHEEESPARRPTKVKKTHDEKEALIKEITNYPLEDERVFDDCDVVRQKMVTFMKDNSIPRQLFAEKALGLSLASLNIS